METFLRELVDKLLSPVSVNLSRQAKFAEPLRVDSPGNFFHFFVLNWSDEHIFFENICHTKNVFVLTTGSQHWAEEVRKDPLAGLLQ